MKTLLIGMFILIATTAAHASDKIVATCGTYKLEQSESTTYFHGIAHKQNNYQIINASGESITAEILTNSEGAVFNATETLAINEETGEATNYKELTLTAMSGQFYLTTISKDGSKTTDDCK